MFVFLKDLLGRPDANIDELISKGAMILDVRTEREFSSGHLDGAVNIPLDRLQTNVSTLNKNRPIITCCASGIRSATAKRILIQNGFAQVFNGGSWTNLKRNAR